MELIGDLFKRFSVIYGHLWNSQFRVKEIIVVMKNEWFFGLKGFTGSEILRAIEYCRTHVELPPTLPMFIDFCGMSRPKPVASASHREFLPAPMPRKNYPLAQRELEKLSKILSRTRNQQERKQL